MKINPLTLIDWYKADHRRQYPPGTTLVFCNMTPRKSRIEGVEEITFFGLQYFIKQYLIDAWDYNFFKMPLQFVLDRWNRRKDNALGPNEIGVEHIARLHDLGYLPIQIMALPEGAQVPMKVPPFVLWNTRSEFFWLPNHLETIMSVSTWQSSTSATKAREYHKLFKADAIKTVGNADFVQWQGHDFSFRGMGSLESACMSGAAHLLYFTGSDTAPAIDFLEQYYNADCTKELIGGSVPATEHSVMCMGGQENEIETFQRLMHLYLKGILSVVSDSWDFWKVMTEYLPKLKDQIMARDGKLVIRPDSGDPVDIICGLDTKPGFSSALRGTHRTAGQKGTIEILWEIFGGTVSEQGYKVLDSHIGLIYGDSITIDRATEINQRLMAKGFASINWVAGIGSYTYQMNTRDTFGFAVKATYGELQRPGETLPECREIFKDPKTDDGTKKSAKGLLAVFKDNNGKYYLKDQATWEEVLNCEYKPVFCNSKLLVDHKLSKIRERALNY